MTNETTLDCDCRSCVWVRGAFADGTPQYSRMILCPLCGNKRCPRATDHENACTNSNAPGQPGSSY